MRLPVKIIGGLAFLAIAACGGLVGAAGAAALAWMVHQALPSITFEIVFVCSIALYFPLGLWAQFRLMKTIRPRLAMLERRLAKGSVVSYDDVREPFTLLLRAFADDVTIVHRTPANPIELLTDNRLETWIVDAVQEIGPVVAVGLPGEKLPHTGALRLYLDHQVWKQRVRYLISRARATIIVVGETGGLWWEIETTLREAAAARLALVFPIAAAPSWEFTGFYRRNEVPKPRMPPHVLERLDQVLVAAGFQAAPRPGPRDQVLVLDGSRRPKFLKTRMALGYYALLINPVTILMKLLGVLYPSMPLRMSLASQVSYKRTFAPFVRSIRATPKTVQN